MKKIIYVTGILAAVALSFSACQKEQEINEEPQSGKLVTVSFTAEKAGIETRTGIANEGTTVSYEWTNEDANNIKLFTVSNTDSGENLTQVTNTEVSVTANKLTISAQVEANAEYTFRSIIAGTWTNDGKKPRINVDQTPSSTDYDPNADVLVSNDVDVTVGETTTGELPLVFDRKVVINKMTLLNMTDGEKVAKVVISSDKNLAGTLSGDKDAITVNYSNAEVPSSGEFPVYFVTIPNEGQTLTVEVTTDQNVYSKTFASTIDFILGKFTKFKVALPAGAANTALSLPLEDSMGWAITGGDDETSELQVSALTAMQGTKKIYDSATKAFRGGTGLKLGTSSVNGSITTNPIDLSSNFYVTIEAKTYGTDNSQLTVSVDGSVIKSVDLTGEYQTYNINCPLATNASKVTIGVAGKRGYIKNLLIRSGGVPEISVTSNNPIEVGNSASSQEIAYTINNPSSGVSLTASTEANWITNLSVATSGKVTFDVAAQEQGDPYREAIITLSYEGAPSVDVTVQQAAGETSPYAAIHTSNVTLTTTGGTSASTAKVNDYDAIKAGTSSVAGAVQITVPANKKNLHIHAAGWKGENVTISISGAATSPTSLKLITDDGITSNSPFTLNGNADDYYFRITIPESTTETELTFSATSGKRFVIWGVNIEDPRQDAGMSWSSETASATITNSGVEFTAPTLTLGNAHDVTYNSTNTSVATINSAGEVTVLAEGTTTIQAIFAGDDDYKPAKVEYTLSVTDNSSTTPTLKYTLDGSDSTQGDNGYATDSNITQGNISWTATANTKISPWRFGGKNLTDVDRAVYSKTAISSNISSIEVESGTATATINSLTITVHNTAADAASGENAIATKTVTSDIVSSTVTLTKSDATSWAGKFYRIVYNVTAGSSNQYVQFVSAKFYGTN